MTEGDVNGAGRGIETVKGLETGIGIGTDTDTIEISTGIKKETKTGSEKEKGTEEKATEEALVATKVGLEVRGDETMTGIDEVRVSFTIKE